MEVLKLKFNEAISMMINCETQEEIDYYWSKLTHGGEEGQFGWLKDKFGVSWQVYPVHLEEIMKDTDIVHKEKVMKELYQMKKFDISKIELAY